MSSSVVWTEVAWTAAALPGLVLWSQNWWEAQKTMRAVKLIGIGNGRLLVARHARRQTFRWFGTQLMVVLTGVVGMLSPPVVPGRQPSVLGLTVLACLIVVSLHALVGGLDWRRTRAHLQQIVGDRDTLRDDERDAVRDPIRDQERDVARDEERDEPRDDLRDAQRDVPRDEDRDVLRDIQRDPRRDTARDADVP